MEQRRSQIPREMGSVPFGIIEVPAKAAAAISTRNDGASRQQLVLDLPLPPSINRTSGTRLGSEHQLVKAWRRQANAHLIVTRQNKHLKLMQGTVSIDIIWDIQNLADIDNRIKHLFDYLQWIGVVTNDNKIRDMHVGVGVAPAGCRIRLRGLYG